MSSGISVPEGLKITAKTSGNRVTHDTVMGARASIAGGETIPGPLAEARPSALEPITSVAMYLPVFDVINAVQ